MKRRIYRAFVSLAVALVAVCSVLFYGGCYTVKAGAIKEIVGTYELTRYSTTEDEIAAQGMRCYMVVTASGNGWFAYEDNDTPLFYAELKLRFIADTQEPSKYAYVEVSFKEPNKWHKLGVNVSAKNLNSRQAEMKGNIIDGNYGVDYYIDVAFTRKAKSTDLSYVEKQLGAAQTVLPYGAIALNGLYGYGWRDGVDETTLEEIGYEEPTVYAYFTLDLYTGKAKAFYMLKSDETQREEEYDLIVTAATSTADCGDGRYFNAQMGSKTYLVEVLYGSVRMAVPQALTIDGETQYLQLHFVREGEVSHFDLAATIQTKIDAYQSSKN